MILVNPEDHRADVWFPHCWLRMLNLSRSLNENESFLRKAEATSEIARSHLWIWLIMRMSLSVVTWGLWAYLDSFVYDLSEARSNESSLENTWSWTNDPSWVNDSMTFDCSSVVQRKALLFDSFLDFFLGKTLKIAWYHSWSLMSWGNTSSGSSRSLLIELSLISKTPSLRVDHVDFELWWCLLSRLLFFWLDDVEVEVVLEGVEQKPKLNFSETPKACLSEDDCHIAPAADEAVGSGMRPAEWTASESFSWVSNLTCSFCWRRNFGSCKISAPSSLRPLVDGKKMELPLTNFRGWRRVWGELGENRGGTGGEPGENRGRPKEPGENRGHLGREPGENRGRFGIHLQRVPGEKRGLWDKNRGRTGGREFSLKRETQLGPWKSTNRTARES